MSKPDRTLSRARKAFAHAVAAHADAKADRRAAGAVAKAERHARHERRAYIEALRLADLEG